MNVTTLLVPLFVTAALARRITPESTVYVDIDYPRPSSCRSPTRVALWCGSAFGPSMAKAWALKISRALPALARPL